MENLMKRMRTVTKEIAIPPYPILIARLVSFACNNEDFVQQLQERGFLDPTEANLGCYLKDRLLLVIPPISPVLALRRAAAVPTLRLA